MVSFRIDGTAYEIDLCAENAAGLRGTLAPYIAAGRKAGRRSNQAARTEQICQGPAARPLQHPQAGGGQRAHVKYPRNDAIPAPPIPLTARGLIRATGIRGINPHPGGVGKR